MLRGFRIYGPVKLAKFNENLLEENKIDYVIQINGKKELLNETRDIDQESLLTNKNLIRCLKDI